MGRVLQIGVVGCGRMGQKHATKCNRTNGVSVVAVSDVDADRAEALASEVEAIAYPDATSMLANVPLDAIVIATPPEIRQSVVEAAATAGTAIFVEKPLALNLATAKACCAAVENASVINAVGFQLRYSPLTQLARALIAGKTLTHVRTACTTYHYLMMNMPIWLLQRAHSGGPLLDQSIHVLDAARYLVGDITHVFAVGDRLVRRDLEFVDVEDTIILAYRFANRALGTHTDSCAMQQFNFEVELLGPNWRILVDYARSQLNGFIGEDIIHEQMPEGHLHELEMEVFIDAVFSSKQSTILSNFADATKTLSTMLAGNRSLETRAWESIKE